MSADDLHRAIAGALDEQMLEKARARLDRWARTAPGTHAQRWRLVLDMPVAQVRELLTSDEPQAVELRGSVPFLGVFDVETRRRVVDLFTGSGGAR